MMQIAKTFYDDRIKGKDELMGLQHTNCNSFCKCSMILMLLMMYLNFIIVAFVFQRYKNHDFLIKYCMYGIASL